jgi:hypothetical protein
MTTIRHAVLAALHLQQHIGMTTTTCPAAVPTNQQVRTRSKCYPRLNHACTGNAVGSNSGKTVFNFPLRSGHALPTILG